jgi:hypothetical protein
MTDIQSAAERLRTIDPTNLFYWRSDAPIRDCEVLARAYLAEHPADDGDLLGTVASIDWLDSLRRADGGDMGMFTIRATGDEIRLIVNGFESLKPNTRGDVRAICRALGIELENHAG